MFLITPKASSSPAANAVRPAESPVLSRPVAKISRARVQKACERCRLKKIKCDGELPCIRCQQDEVICVVSKRDPQDYKAASRDYISALEAQQKAFITTLQNISRNFPQAIDTVGMKEILNIATSHGYEFEGFPEQHTTDSNTDVSVADQCSSLKRRRTDGEKHHEPYTFLDTSETIPDLNRIPERINSSEMSFSAAQNSSIRPRAAFGKEHSSQTASEPTLEHLSIAGRPHHVDSHQDSFQTGETTTTLLPSFLTSTLQDLNEAQLCRPDQSQWNVSGGAAPGNVQADMAMSNIDWTMFQDDIGFGLTSIHSSNNLLDSTLWWDPSIIFTDDANNKDNLDHQNYSLPIMKT